MERLNPATKKPAKRLFSSHLAGLFSISLMEPGGQIATPIPQRNASRISDFHRNTYNVHHSFPIATNSMAIDT